MNRLPMICGMLFLSVSCSYFQPEAVPEAIARVNESYLYKEDIKDLVAPGASKEDSTVIVRNFIDRWASQKLLIEGAEKNLNDTKQAELNKLVRQYKLDLFTRAYVEEIVKREVDTSVSQAELETYYRENKENFKTNGTLVRLRYVNLKKDNPKLETIKKKFFDFRRSDRKFWESFALQLNSFALNDTVWVGMAQVYSRLPFINPDNRDNYIVPGNRSNIRIPPMYIWLRSPTW